LSDDDFKASWAGEEELKRLPSWAQYQLGYRTIASAVEKEDADETLFAQLTYPELALIPFALLIVSRLFPELTGAAGRLSTKLHDLAEAQEFLTQKGDSE
jgi:hypothetical protein